MGRAKLVHRTETLVLPEAGLRLVVVADTHSAAHPRTDELVAASRPDHILHAGDIGALAVIDQLARIAPTSFVRGNIDAPRAAHGDSIVELPDALTLRFYREGDPDGSEPALTLLLVHIAVNGPRIRPDVARLARHEGAKLIVCGHSHVPFLGRDRDLNVFNPGSIGPRRFHLPIVFGVIDIRPDRVELKHVNCETGERWLPT